MIHACERLVVDPRPIERTKQAVWGIRRSKERSFSVSGQKGTGENIKHTRAGGVSMRLFTEKSAS
jgi:hypothetical protein